MAPNPDRMRMREITASIKAKREIIERLQGEIKQQSAERASLKQKVDADQSETASGLQTS